MIQGPRKKRPKPRQALTMIVKGWEGKGKQVGFNRDDPVSKMRNTIERAERTLLGPKSLNRNLRLWGEKRGQDKIRWV